MWYGPDRNVVNVILIVDIFRRHAWARGGSSTLWLLRA